MKNSHNANAQAAPAAGSGKGGVNFRTVRALLRKNGQERRSMFRAGQFDFFGFLLRILLIAAIVALFVMFFGRFVDVYVSIKINDKTDVMARSTELLTILYSAVILGMVIGGVGQIGRELFAADDMKILSAMPINAKTLFLAKLISIYRGQLVIALVSVFTINVTFALKVGVTLVFWALTLIICFLLPLITILISAVLVLPFQAIKRFLRERFVLTFILVTAILGVSFWLYSIIVGGVKQLLLGDSLRYFFNARVMKSIRIACSWLYPARWFANIISGSDPIWSWLELAAVAIVCILLAMLVIKRILVRSMQARNQGSSASILKTSYVMDKRNKFVALLKKEFLMIFRTPSYMFSYFSVAVIMPLMVYFCMDVGASLVENLVGLDSSLELALFLTILFGALTNIFCATNISRDGEMFYSVKALPLDFRTVFFSKIVLCLIVTAFSQVASAVLLFATGIVGAVDALFLVFVGLLFSFVNIAVATRYDFNHAHFSSEDDGEIKESSGTVSKVIFMGMLLSFAVGGLVLILKIFAQLRQFAYGALTYILAGGLAVISAGLATLYLLLGLKKKYYEFSGGGI